MKQISDRYFIKDKLGQGRSSITYRAIDKETNEQVAIKSLSLTGLNDWKKIELFERKAKILQQLEHPAIPRYLDYFQIATDDNLYFYIVQQLAPGKSLFELVESGWRTTETEVKDIARQILNILSYLHSLEPPVIHRDIKPNNLIRSDDGTIYLVDFGAVQNTYYNTLMRGSAVVGTYGYMAPEQFRGKALPATDLYSLGATILYLLTHRSPRELPQDTLKLNFRSAVNISESFANWLEKILEPDLEDRFTSAEVALRELLASNKIKQKKVFKGIGVGVLCLALVWSFTSYKWFFLSRLGFYPDNLCVSKIVMKDYLEKGGKANVFIPNSSYARFFYIQHPEYLSGIFNKTDYDNEYLIHCLLRYLYSNKYNIVSFNNDIEIPNKRKYSSEEINMIIDKELSDTKEILKSILKQDIDIEIKDTFYQDTPLINALLWLTKDKDIIKMLIDYGANINQASNAWQPPLHLAVSSNNLEIVKLLIDSGANINIRDKEKKTSLFDVSSIDIARLLIDNGIDVNARDKNKKTALFHTKNKEILKLLIDNGIDPNMKDRFGKTYKDY